MAAHITFVIGGASCGKSSIAEQLVQATGRNAVYLATAQAFDDEMREKIAAHRMARGRGWTTIEEPLDIVPVLGRQSHDGILLLDCATLWLTNVMLGDHDVDAACAALVASLPACPCPVVVVSNEVGQGIVPDNALSRRFRAAQGRLNQAIAAQADRVITVMAGLPLVLKGDPL